MTLKHPAPRHSVIRGGLLLLLPLAGVILVAGVISSFLRQDAQGHPLRHLTDRQRMLSAELLSWTNMVARGHEEDRQGLRLRTAEFGDTLDVPRQGGGAPAEIRAALDQVADLWRESKPDLDLIAGVPRNSPAFRKAYGRIRIRLVDLSGSCDRVAAVLEARRTLLQRRMLYVLPAIGCFAGLIFAAALALSRWKADVVLQTSEQRYRTLYEKLPDILYDYSAKRGGLSYSPSVEWVLGYPPAYLCEHPFLWNESIHPDDRAMIARVISKIPKREAFDIEYRIKGRDGAWHWFRDRAMDWKGEGDDEIVSAIASDITARKRAEEERELAEEKLRQSQKMEVVGRLAGGVAHDFNNILTTILGCSDFLLQNLKPQDPSRTDVLDIKAAGVRAAALTKQLLAFSRKQMLSPQRLDVNAVVAETRSMLRRLIGEDVELSIRPDSQPLIVDVDRGQLEQIVMNLVLNARDAMPHGGKILVETASLELEKAHVHRYGTIPPGSYATLAVSDAGIGMSEEVLSHLFEPFFTTKEKGKGTGLGLSTVEGIVAQSGGHIVVSSEEGRGSTFKIHLPKAGAQSDPVGSAAVDNDLPRGSGVVLLVEDEAPVRELVRRMLTRNGFTVIATGDPREALTLCERHQEPIRLLVTDIVMPRVNGLELARKVRAAQPGIRVLYMSGYTDHFTLEQGSREIEGAFLQKPFVSREFLEKVHQILGSHDRARD